MSARKQSATMKQVVKEATCCELCGSKRSLEAHHIIPVVCGGDDSLDNLIAICVRCHALLTPRSQLCKIGIENAKFKDSLHRFAYQFYDKIGEELDKIEANHSLGWFGAEDVMDIFEQVFDAELERRIKNE